MTFVTNIKDGSETFIEGPESFRPDVIVSWPKNCDYPLWRAFIATNRSLLGKVIISFTETNMGHDYREFVKKSLFKYSVNFIDAPLPRGDEDWRNLSVNRALLHSYNSEWIWFTEQDFLIINESLFWDEIYLKVAMGFDVIGIAEQGRLHPACIFVKRDILNKTKKNFGIVPGVSDHFSLFQKDIENAGVKRAYLADEEGLGYKHLNGFSHNWRLASEGLEPNYKIDDFMTYLKACLGMKDLIPINDEFERVAKDVLSKFDAN